MAATEAGSAIHKRTVDVLHQARELLLEPAGLVVIKESDNQYHRVYSSTERDERERKAEYLGVVEMRQDGDQHRERSGHGQSEDQADQGKTQLSMHEGTDHHLAVTMIIL